MKIKPVVDALDELEVEVNLVHTGQHYDAQMSDVFFDDIDLRAPDHHLGVGSGSHAEQTARVMVTFEQLVSKVLPQMVVVAGDVNPTMACAIVGAKNGVLVAHVEAGLRSRDWSMPEEVNRVVTDRVSDLLLAPSDDAVANLKNEGIDGRRIALVGNTMIDTLLRNLERAMARPILKDLGLSPGAFALATLHRPANVDDLEILARLVHTLKEIARILPVVFPVHPRTSARLGTSPLDGSIILTPPLGYLDFLGLEAQASVVLTDSGGVQEETTVLGVPCLTLHDNTERPITIDQGTNLLVGRDPQRILTAVRNVLERGVVKRRPELWDGRAGERIAAMIVSVLAVQGHYPGQPIRD